MTAVASARCIGGHKTTAAFVPGGIIDKHGIISAMAKDKATLQQSPPSPKVFHLNGRARENSIWHIKIWVVKEDLNSHHRHFAIGIRLHLFSLHIHRLTALVVRYRFFGGPPPVSFWRRMRKTPNRSHHRMLCGIKPPPPLKGYADGFSCLIRDGFG